MKTLLEARIFDPAYLALRQSIEGKNFNPVKHPGTRTDSQHAEVYVLSKLVETGTARGKDVVIVVDGKAVCTYCRKFTHLPLQAALGGLKSLTVIDRHGKSTLVWHSDAAVMTELNAKVQAAGFQISSKTYDVNGTITQGFVTIPWNTELEARFKGGMQ